MEFLKNFYDIFPQYKTMDVRVPLAVVLFLYLIRLFLSKTYLAGESFAGQWIPYYGQ
jgi:carboxypeptidase D